MTAPGQIATLILPADTAWGPGGPVAAAAAPTAPPQVDEAAIRAAAEACAKGAETVIFLGGLAVRDRTLRFAAAIAEKTGCRFMGRTALPRLERGAGAIHLPRLPYAVDDGLTALKDVRTLILLGAADPVSFFGYPGKPSRMMPEGAALIPLATPQDDMHGALAALADLVGAKPESVARIQYAPPSMPQAGRLTAETAMAAVGALLPEGAVIVDESLTSGRWSGPMTAKSAPHDWLQITGGSIGIGPPLALGAAVAARDRKVVNLQADGSAMYTLQALWSQARAGANVLTIIWANRTYEILRGELMNVGANPGRKALDMLSLNNPALDWVKLSEGMGVPARSTETTEDFIEALHAGLSERGPFLIEALI
jgi:acetolactate synthase I/II/III large subunit